MDIAHIVALLAIVITVYSVRLISILPFYKLSHNDNKGNISLLRKTEGHNKNKPMEIFVYLGSGGHTGEMLRLLSNYKNILMDDLNTLHIGFSDLESKRRFEAMNQSKCKVKFYRFKKAREVGAGFIQSIRSILDTLLNAFEIVLSLKFSMLNKPHLVLLNGPGTCCIITVWFKLLDLLLLFTSSNIVYIESLARVSTLSLTGKILYWLVDDFIVQWDELRLNKVPRAKYFGILV